MNKKIIYLIASIIAIILSYISAVIGSGVTDESLRVWHITFSTFTLLGGVFGLFVTLTEI